MAEPINGNPTLEETDVVVRDATPADANTIADFNIAMALETESKTLDAGLIKKGVKHIFAAPDDGFYLVAERGESVAGCLMVTREWSDWRNGVFWWIQSVYVHPDHRRCGVFKTLYQTVSERAHMAENVCGIRLYVEKGNISAQNTYAELGMTDSNYRVFEEML